MQKIYRICKIIPWSHWQWHNVSSRTLGNSRHHCFKNVLWHLARRPRSKVILCVVHVDFHKFHFMCKYSQYAIYAITYMECTICKSIPNMQHMQKHPTFCNICKIYQICKISNKIPKYAINIPKMQNHYLIYFCKLCIPSMLCCIYCILRILTHKV